MNHKQLKKLIENKIKLFLKEEVDIAGDPLQMAITSVQAIEDNELFSDDIRTKARLLRSALTQVPARPGI